MLQLRDGELSPEREKHMIHTRKKIVAIAWSDLGFTLSKSFPRENQLMRHIISNISWN
jgi:hypothetical protein